MDNSTSILSNMVNFLLVGIVFVIVLAITFKVSLKNYNVKTSKIKFYGLFLGMDNRSVLAFSLITLNYIFLIWCTATFSGLNIYYVFITVFLMLFADIIVKNYNQITLDLLYSMANIGCIFVTSMLQDYLVNKYNSVLLLIILGLLCILVFLYFTYMTFRLLNNIVIKEENLAKKNYKKL